MGREHDNEKKFNAYIDRILAGEEIKVDLAMDKELRDALVFARKISAMGTMPSAQFRAQLKARLLQKLEAQQAQEAAQVKNKRAKGSFFDIFRSHPAWQGAVAVLLVIIALTIVWRAGVFQPVLNEKSTVTVPATTSPPVVKTAAPATTAAAPAKTGDRGIGAALVSIDAKSDKASYKSGETVTIQLSLRNITAGQLTVKDFPPILSIMQEDTKQPVYNFSAGKETRTLAPNAVATYAYTWQQTDFKGNPVSGKYYIELEDLEYNGVPIKLYLNNPVNFEIVLK
jgi:hypothetical protein